jgi:hypothetical protein
VSRGLTFERGGPHNGIDALAEGGRLDHGVGVFRHVRSPDGCDDPRHSQNSL